MIIAELKATQVASRRVQFMEITLTQVKAKYYHEAGLTLIEISVVVLIIAIILAFAFPVASNTIRAYNLRSAADHLAERLAGVRALALAKNKNVTFSFNNSSGKYGFDFTGTDGDGVPDTTDPEDPTINYNLTALPNGITATFPGGNPIKVTFNSRGELPIGSTEKHISISNGRGSMSVQVNLRGKIAVQ
jgi:prepilin-type N-terminal cleavage/methylation domain-containing protein